MKKIVKLCGKQEKNTFLSVVRQEGIALNEVQVYTGILNMALCILLSEIAGA